MEGGKKKMERKARKWMIGHFSIRQWIANPLKCWRMEKEIRRLISWRELI